MRWAMSWGASKRLLKASAAIMNRTKIAVMVSSDSKKARSTSPETYRCRIFKTTASPELHPCPRSTALTRCAAATVSQVRRILALLLTPSADRAKSSSQCRAQSPGPFLELGFRGNPEGQPKVVAGNGSRLGSERILSRHIEDSLLQAPREKRPLESGIDLLRNSHPDEQSPVGVGPAHVRLNGCEMALERCHEHVPLLAIQLAQARDMTIVVAAGQRPLEQLLVEVRRPEVMIPFQSQDRIDQAPG